MSICPVIPVGWARDEVTNASASSHIAATSQLHYSPLLHLSPQIPPFSPIPTPAIHGLLHATSTHGRFLPHFPGIGVLVIHHVATSCAQPLAATWRSRFQPAATTIHVTNNSTGIHTSGARQTSVNVAIPGSGRNAALGYKYWMSMSLIVGGWEPEREKPWREPRLGGWA